MKYRRKKKEQNVETFKKQLTLKQQKALNATTEKIEDKDKKVFKLLKEREEQKLKAREMADNSRVIKKMIKSERLPSVGRMTRCQVNKQQKMYSTFIAM